MGKNRTQSRKNEQLASLGFKTDSIDLRLQQDAMFEFESVRQATMTEFINMAISRFKYIDAPDEFVSSELEWRLLTKGEAIMFNIGDDMYTLDVVKSGNLDLYGRPQTLEAVGYNFNKKISAKNGVHIFDRITKHKMYHSTLYQLNIFASEIANLKAFYRVNQEQLQVPYTIMAPEEMKDEIEQTYARRQSVVPFIFTQKGVDGGLDIKAEKLDIAPDFLLDKINKEIMYWRNRAKSLLGINFKEDVYSNNVQSQTKDQISSNEEEIRMARLSFLIPRREALDEYNKKHGTDIKVVWNFDDESDNYMIEENIAEQARLGLIGQGVTTTALDTGDGLKGGEDDEI